MVVINYSIFRFGIIVTRKFEFDLPAEDRSLNRSLQFAKQG